MSSFRNCSGEGKRDAARKERLKTSYLFVYYQMPSYRYSMHSGVWTKILSKKDKTLSQKDKMLSQWTKVAIEFPVKLTDSNLKVVVGGW